MIKLKHKLFALLLLLSFLGVQLISIGCTLINFSHQVSHSINSKSETNHGHAHHHSDSDKSTSKTKEESCCVENTSVFLSGIQANLNSVSSILPQTILIINTHLSSNIFALISLKLNSLQIRPPPNRIILTSSEQRITILSLQI